jgi:integrase
MPTVKLTKRKVDEICRGVSDTLAAAGESAGPPLRRSFWYDVDLKGFGLKVEPTGKMSWIVEYRPGAGGRRTQKKRLTLAAFGKLTPEEARDLAKGTLVRVHKGEDPVSQKVAARVAMTVTELCDLYIAEAEKGHVIGKRGSPKKESTLVADRGRVARHIKPLIGGKKARDVTRADVERFQRDIAGGKTAADIKTKKHGRAIVTGGRGTATRTLRLLGGIFSFAITLGVRADNPVHGVRKYADAEGMRFLSGEELDRLGSALREAETLGLPWRTNEDGQGAKHLPKEADARRTRISPYAAAAIRLLIFTGCRLREILQLEWKNVDMQRGLLLLPDSKTGAKVVVLGAPALNVLAELPRVDGCGFVVVGDNLKKPRSDLKRPWAMITHAAGVSGVRIHDLRHTFASYAAAGGMGLTIVGRLLGHADVKTTNRYSHLADDPLRRAADSVGSALAAAMGVGGKDDNVVSLTSGKQRS